MGAPGSDGVVQLIGADCSVQVRHPLRVLLIEHAVRVQAIGPTRIVLENDLDRIPHLGANQGAKDPEMGPILRPRSQRFETGVGVFSEDRFAVCSGVGV